MNAISLNNLWSYLQSLSLTTSNKKWLADHLYEAVSKESGTAKFRKKFTITKEDLVLSDDILEIVKDITPLPSDYDFEQERLNYLMKKYG